MNGAPTRFRTVGDVVFFTVTDDGVRSLWRSDGTPGGTLPVRTLPHPEVEFVADDGIRLFFLAGPPFELLDLWVSDGTASGTFPLTDELGVLYDFYTRGFPHWLSKAGVLVFEAWTGSRATLWATDGTPDGTFPLVDPDREELSGGIRMVGAGSEAYFAVRIADSGWAELWRTDGSPHGTRPIALDLAPSWHESYAMLGDSLLVVTGSADPRAAAIWRVDPAVENPQLVSRELMAPDDERSWTASFKLNLDDRVVLEVVAGLSYVLPTGAPIDVEMWSTDGTPEGTVRFDESQHIAVVDPFGNYAPLVVDDWAYFVGYDADHGRELWRSNGLPGGAERLTDLCPGRCDGVGHFVLERIGSFLVVQGSDGQTGWEPWVVPIDPSRRPWLLGDLCPGPCDGGPIWVEQIGRSVVMAATLTSGFPYVLWETDLTPERMRMLQSRHLSQNLSHQRARLGDRLLLPIGTRLEIDPWVLVAEPATCESARGDACFQGGNVEVSVRWSLEDGIPKRGWSVPMTERAAYFWFFRPTNVELVVKLLDGCAVNGRRWLFVTGLTDVGVEIRVRDFHTWETKRYETSAGTAFAPILDTEALSCDAI